MTLSAHYAELAAIFRSWERAYDKEAQNAKDPILRVMCEQAWEASSDLAEVNERAATAAYAEARP